MPLYNPNIPAGDFATPNLTIGNTAAAGVAVTTIRSDATFPVRNYPTRTFAQLSLR